MSSTEGRISAAPSEQLTPTISGFACWTESQNASTVCPERLRPLLSIAVNDSHSGSSGGPSRAGTTAALALSESNAVSTSRRSTPPSRSARIWCAYASRTSSKLTARYAGSSTLGASESVTLNGRRARAPLVGGAAREARAFEVHLLHDVLAERVVSLPDCCRRERVRRRDVS